MHKEMDMLYESQMLLSLNEQQPTKSKIKIEEVAFKNINITLSPDSITRSTKPDASRA